MTLAVRDLRVAYGNKLALHGVSFEIQRGEVYALVGESGSGKTTAALAVMRYLPYGGRVLSGSIELDSDDILKLEGESLRRIRGSQLAMVYQNPASALNPSMPVGKQVEEVFRAKQQLRPAEALSGALDLMRQVRLQRPEYVFDRYPHQLSGGMQQRIVIAIALASSPRVLVLDEPTTGLDATVEASVLSLLAELQRERGMAILFITHNLRIVSRMADRVGVLQGGRLVEEGATADVFQTAAHPYTRQLLASAARLSGSPAVSRGRAETVDGDLLMVERAVKKFRAGGSTTVALDGVSLQIGKGDTFGLVGESGSGKSTLARSIAGLERLDDGTLRLDGASLERPADRRSRDLLRRLQMVFQDPDSTLNPAHRVRRILDRSLKRLTRLDHSSRAQRIENLMSAVQLDTALLDAYPSQLSGGQKQRVAIARAFASEPELVLCDEPVSSLDVTVQAAVLDLLESLQRTRAASYLFISHDIAVVRYLADHVGVLYAGQLVEVGPAKAVFAPPHHPYTELLLSAVRLSTVPPEVRGTPSADARPSVGGCVFQARCPRKLGAICESSPPPWRTSADGAQIRCHIPIDELRQSGDPA
jgi:oligopeptide/dipeptide ABC transporter ATP-binding protein